MFILCLLSSDIRSEGSIAIVKKFDLDFFILHHSYSLKICFGKNVCVSGPPWYLYLVVVEWLACLYDPESYAGGSIAARMVTHTGQVKGDKPDKKVPWSKE